MVHRRVRQNNDVEKLRTVTMHPLHGYGRENWEILASFNKTIQVTHKGKHLQVTRLVSKLLSLESLCPQSLVLNDPRYQILAF